ncbi:UNVERIFIED_CONTAM: hypothetical protein HHA_247960 [Hammondia hammondi]|eukprot:XP_008883823.1 hypothetical protein HHA_247960 [Hammondia hammondi]
MKSVGKHRRLSRISLRETSPLLAAICFLVSIFVLPSNCFDSLLPSDTVLFPRSFRSAEKAAHQHQAAPAGSRSRAPSFISSDRPVTEHAGSRSSFLSEGGPSLNWIRQQETATMSSSSESPVVKVNYEKSVTFDGPVLRGGAALQGGVQDAETNAPVGACSKMLEVETSQFKTSLPPFGCPAATVDVWHTVYLLYAPFEGLVDMSLPPSYRQQLAVLKDTSLKQGWHTDPKSLPPECQQALLWLHCKMHDTMILCGGKTTGWKYSARSDFEIAQQYCSKTESPIFAACQKVAQDAGSSSEAYPFGGCRSFNEETGSPGTAVLYAAGNRVNPSLSLSLTGALVIGGFWATIA